MAWSIGQVAVYSYWAWPAAEAVHFLGLALSLGVLLAINLRILGMMKQVAFADVHRLLPWGMLGFGANLITGMFFFVGQPAQYTSSDPFYWKVAFLVIAVAVNQSPRSIRRHLERHPMPFATILWDDRGNAVRAFDAFTTSYVVVLDAAGKVAYTGTGEDQDIAAVLNRVVGRGR